MSNTESQQSLDMRFFKERAAEFWQERDVRERRYLIVMTIVICCALVYGVLLSPALRGTKELKDRIPLARQQVAEMANLSKKSAQLQSILNEPVAEISKDTLESTLNRNGIKWQVLSVSDDVVRLQISSVAYVSMMECLVEWQKNNRLSVEEAKLQALPEVGMVSATISLKQLRSGT
jgi:general secretion pathway protein M